MLSPSSLLVYWTLLRCDIEQCYVKFALGHSQSVPHTQGMGKLEYSRMI